ncbi:MAG TPA: hypothetical protein VES19_05605 [Candidatus Limnocylindrales bacterium]|nr:hypothetical protein [Candidatus Limnocylindrales bacterium]
MDRVQALESESRVLRWGGLAGVAGGLLFLLVFVIVGTFVPAYAAEPAAAVRWFPDVRTVRIVENGLYLAVLILWVMSVVALFRATRPSLAPALFGSVLGIVGLALLAAGALPHVAIAPLSELYHAPAATPGDQATLALAWLAAQGMLDALLVAGLVVLPVSLVALGVAMAGTPAFGMRWGAFALGLGLIGLVAATVALVNPASPAAAIGMFALIAFHIACGWKTWALSRSGRMLDDRLAVSDPAGAPRVALERAG